MFMVVTMNLAHVTGYSMSYNIRDFDVTCHVVDVCVFIFFVVVVVILFFITFFVVVKSVLLGVLLLGFFLSQDFNTFRLCMGF